MKRVRVIQSFHDKDNYNKVYKVGDVVTFDETRANKLIALRLAEEIKVSKRKEE